MTGTGRKGHRIMERNILLTIEYDGSGFSGWQRQPHVRTVQGEIEEALSRICGCEIQITGTSRTDAGVHALGQRASFKGDFGIPTENIRPALNNILAGGGRYGAVLGDIRIIEAAEVGADFHARFDARGKKYRYIIENKKYGDIFRRKYCYNVDKPLDEEALKKAAQAVTGTHDFASFQSAGGQPRLTTVRTVHTLDIYRQGDDVIMEITGDGFLYNMVRIIAGTLTEIGMGKRRPQDMVQIINARDRAAAGHKAPAGGLYLAEIYF